MLKELSYQVFLLNFLKFNLYLLGSGGYKYFGAAKDLPKVRELFEKEIPSAPKKSRTELYKRINYQYYGYSNPDYLVPIEESYEKQWREEAVRIGIFE
jgi:pre-mRNA-splicing factor ISY1